MARYGRDMERDRGFGRGGSSGGMERGGGWRGGEYGGMGSDAQTGGGSQYGGRSGFGTGGGAYDNEFGGTNRGGMGGYGGGGSPYGGYGASAGLGGGYGGTETDWGRGVDRGGFGGGMAGGMGRQSFGGGMNRGWAQGGQGGMDVTRMRAVDVMTENPESVTPDTSLADAARKMRDLDVGIIPVVESDSSRRLRGVVTDRDIAVRAVAEERDPASTTVQDVMTTELETCNKNDSLREVMRVMEREQVRRVPITDREGRLVGIIAQADLATELTHGRGEREVADTVESISEPGRPRRGGMRGSQNRGMGGGPRWDASGRGGMGGDV